MKSIPHKFETVIIDGKPSENLKNTLLKITGTTNRTEYSGHPPGSLVLAATQTLYVDDEKTRLKLIMVSTQPEQVHINVVMMDRPTYRSEEFNKLADKIYKAQKKESFWNKLKGFFNAGK